jgi:uncharacterized small protein (DUF1192 family)
MFEEEDRARKISRHEVGMPLDTLSVEELRERIALLHAEVARLEQAVTVKEKTRLDANSLFKL